MVSTGGATGACGAGGATGGTAGGEFPVGMVTVLPIGLLVAAAPPVVTFADPVLDPMPVVVTKAPEFDPELGGTNRASCFVMASMVVFKSAMSCFIFLFSDEARDFPSSESVSTMSSSPFLLSSSLLSLFFLLLFWASSIFFLGAVGVVLLFVFLGVTGVG